MKLTCIKKQSRSCFLHLTLFLVLILLSSCGSGSDSSFEASSETGSIAFSVELRGPTGEAAERQAAAIDCEAADVATVEAQVFDESNNLLVDGGPWDCTLGQGTIKDVTAGSNRKVVILGRDSNDTLLYRGEKSDITVTAGQTANVGTIVLNLVQYTLPLAKSGNGNGTVTSSPVGVDCGTDCTGVYDRGIEVSLTATTAADSTFGGWSGGGCSGTGQCIITITSDISVNATFTLKTYTITASAGTGGSISPLGSVTVNHGADQTFTIAPDSGYYIVDVTVDGSSEGVVTQYTFQNVTTDHTISATFAIIVPPLIWDIENWDESVWN